MEPTLIELLHQAIGSGEDAGSVNFKYLKNVLNTVLEKLEIGEEQPKEFTPPPSGGESASNENEKEKKGQANNDELQRRIDDLEKAIEEIMRPNSPNTLIENSKNGEDAIKNDWEQKKLKKRVDANEEGVDRALAILDKLVHEIQDVKKDLDETKKHIDSDQDSQNSMIEDNKKALEELKNDFADSLVDQSQLDDQKNRIDEILEQLKDLQDQQNENLSKCVTWPKLEDSFKRDFLQEGIETDDLCETERKDYPAYFTGLEKLSDYGSKIDELLKDFAENSELVNDLKNKTDSDNQNKEENGEEIGNTNKDLEKANEIVQKNEVNIDEMDKRLADIIAENDKLRRDLENYKAATDREMQNQREIMNGNNGGNGVDDETVSKLQNALSGTEKELSRLHELIKSLQADGNNKNRDLEELQALLRDLQEKAAMSDFVVTNLDKKANASDLAGMLSKDDLDATAQEIINQLQELINKQASTEEQLKDDIHKVGNKIDDRTKNDEFNPFKDEMEQKLRALRKKMEALRKEDLVDLATPAGAAGFRKQLYNCISCDKDIHMRISKPILPEPSAFPARISLRPHTSYDIDQARAVNKEGSVKGSVVDPLRREHSAYSSVVVEKELERRRKMRENKIRQEINAYSFKSGSIPRQVGGPATVPVQPYHEEREYRKQEITGMHMEPADLEGTDGQLYKGRIVKLPEIVRRSPDLEHEMTNRITPLPQEDVHIPHTEVAKD